MSYKTNSKGQITYACGTVSYANSGNTYCVEINVNWGFFCISSIDGIARWVGVGTTTTTVSTTTTTIPGVTTTTTTTSSTTTTIVEGADITGQWEGNINISGFGTVAMEACVTQDDSQFNGDWEVPATSRCGTLSGSVSGTNITLSMQGAVAVGQILAGRPHFRILIIEYLGVSAEVIVPVV